MTRLGVGALLTLLLTTVAGCSPSADEVNDAVGELPGVISAEPACHEFRCTVEIEAELDASADELADMIAAARTVDDAWEVEVSLTSAPPRRVSALLTIDRSPPAEDAAIGALLAWAAAEQELSGLTVERGRAETIHVAGSASEGTSIWPLAREAWAFASELTGASLDFTKAEQVAQQSVRMTGAFPDSAVAVAEELEADDTGLTGVVITDDRFLVGAISRSVAERLRPLLADDRRLDDRAVEVVVSTNVLSDTAQEPGTSERLEPVLAVLEGQPEVLFATIRAGEIEVEIDNLRSAPRLVDRVRRQASGAFFDTTLVLVDQQAGHRVEITPEGDDGVLDLLVALQATDGLRGLDIGQELEPDPARAEVALSIEVRQPGPGTGSAPPIGPEVTRLARLLSTTPGSAASYSLHVEVEDVDGRSADAGWRVDRTPDGLVLAEINGTDETRAEVRAAWARGVG